MWRWAKRGLLAVGGLLAAAAAAGALYQWNATRSDLAANPPPGRLVDIGGRKLHLWCTGAGAPTVVLESGLGGSSFGWGFVQPELGRVTQVCSYDRAGIGYSDPAPSPRTTQRIVDDLSRLLERAGVAPPVVLVGASIGGFSARLFASQRPDRVAGLVLVDASHEDQRMDMPPIAPFVPVLAPIGVFRLLGMSFGPPLEALEPSVRRFARAGAYRTSAYTATASEGTHLPESAAQVKASRRRLAIPVVVLTAGRGTDPLWRDQQRDLVGLSERGCQVIAEESGHTIALTQPKAVVDSVRAVVESARGNDVDPCSRRAIATGPG